MKFLLYYERIASVRKIVQAYRFQILAKRHLERYKSVSFHHKVIL